MAPVLAGDLGAPSSELTDGDSGPACACLRRMAASLRRCCSSRLMFFSFDFYDQISKGGRCKKDL
jgi:hypothetical protein